MPTLAGRALLAAVSVLVCLVVPVAGSAALDPTLAVGARSIAATSITELSTRRSATDTEYLVDGIWLSRDSGCWYCNVGPATAAAVLWRAEGASDDERRAQAITTFDRALADHRRSDGSFDGEATEISTMSFGLELATAYVAFGDTLDAGRKATWASAVAGAADYLVRNGNPTWYSNGNINIGNTAFFWLAWRVTGEQRFLESYETALAFTLSPPQDLWPGFGLRILTAPTAADGSDGSGYLGEANHPGVPGFDAEYTQLQADHAARLYAASGDPRVLRLLNLLVNALLARTDASWSLNASGGTRHPEPNRHIPLLTPALGVLAASGDRPDLAERFASQLVRIEREHREWLIYPSRNGHRALGNQLSLLVAVLGIPGPGPDASPPTQPAELVVDGPRQGELTLAWQASVDDVEVTGYVVSLNGNEVATTTHLAIVLSGLPCSTTSSVSVQALDAAGRRSSAATVAAATLTCPDTTAPSAPAGLVRSGVSQTAIAITWNPSSDDLAVTGYRVYRDGTLTLQLTGTTASLGSLTCSSSYRFSVEARDLAGNTSPRTDITTSTRDCTDTTPPTAPTSLTATTTNRTSITLSWNPSTDNTGVSGYGIYRNNTKLGTLPSPGYTIGALTCGTSYTLAVDAYDNSANTSPKTELTTTTLPCQDTSPPTAPTGLTRAGAGETSITLGWQRSSDDVAVTGYTVYRDGVRAGSTGIPSFTFPGLACGSSYALAVEGADAAGNISPRAGTILTTLPCSDTTAPSAPAGLVRSGVSQTAIAITWNPSSDDLAVTGYRVYRDGTLTLQLTGTTASLGSLTCSSSYRFSVEARDLAGNTSPRTDITTSTRDCTDTTPPTAPTSLTATTTNRTSITLSWNPSTDNTGVSGYGIYRNNTKLGTLPSPGYTIGALTCGTSYTLAVDAYDNSANTSPKTELTTTTLPCQDTSPPTAPGSPVATPAKFSIALSWAPSTDDTAVVGYRVFADGTAVATTAAPQITLNGLTCGRSYALAVEAYDGAGRISPRVSTIASTTACVAGPIAFVKPLGSATAAAADGSLRLFAPPGGVAQGDTVVLFALVSDGTADIASVTDGRGNVYTVDATVRKTGPPQTTFVLSGYAATRIEDTDTITVRFAGATGAVRLATGAVFSGIAAISRVDASRVSSGPAGSTGMGISVTTATQGALVVGAFGIGNETTVTRGPSLTELTQVRSTGAATLFSEYQVAGTAGPKGANAYRSVATGSWAGAAVAYRSA